MRVSAEEVMAGLYAWLQQNAWFTKIDIKPADLTQEVAAQQALLLLASNDKAAFLGLPLGVQALAARFVYSFIHDLNGPLKSKAWPISDALAGASPAALTWSVIAAEIERTNPPPQALH